MIKITKDYILLIAIFFIGFLAAILWLGDKSFWMDEVYSVLFSHGSLEALFTQAASDVHPPFYFLLLHLWIKIFGESEFWVRFLSLIPFAFSLFVLYKIGQELFNEKVGLLGTLLCALSPVIILYSRMARYYSLTAFLMLLSILFFIKLWKETRLSYWIFYSLAVILVLYTDYPSYFYLLLSQSLIIVFLSIFQKRFVVDPKRFLGCHMVAWLLYGPWALVLFRTTGTLLGKAVDVDITLGPLAYLLKLLFPFYSFTFGETIFPWHFILMLGGIFVFGIALGRGFVEGVKSKREGLVALVILTLGMVLINSVLLSIFVRTHSFIYYPRAILFSAYIYLLLVAFGLSKFREGIRAILIVVIVAVNLFSINNIYQLNEYFNPFYIIPWKEVASFVRENVKDGDIIFSDDLSLKYYLLKIGTKENVQIYSSAVTKELKDRITRRQCKRFWLVLTARDSRIDPEIYGWLKSSLDQGWELKSEKDFAFLDPRYIEFRGKILKKASYRAKLAVRLYGE